MSRPDVPAELATGKLTISGRIRSASNAVFSGSIGEASVVYKPALGEKPLWDFPDGGLARREVAAYLVSDALGWGIVPLTWLRDGPLGAGMVQLWREPDPAQSAVVLVDPDMPGTEGMRRVFDVIGDPDFPIAVAHEDSAALRRIAVFDVIINNADRKGGHILEMTDGRRHGIDHGLTFHVDPKLRTVLWGWAGEPLTADETAGVERVIGCLADGLGAELSALISADELAAFERRCRRLLTASRFPAPAPGWHVAPWPLI